MRTEGVYQHTRFKADYTVDGVRWCIKAISLAQNFLFTANGSFEATAFDIGDLCMRMLVQHTDGTFFKFHFYHHHPVIVSKNLALNAITQILPGHVSGNLK